MGIFRITFDVLTCKLYDQATQPSRNLMKATPPHWKYAQLLACAITWFGKLHKQKKLASEHNALWWCFAFKWKASLESIVCAFIAGQYRFGPMIQYQMPGKTVLMWDYPDRLVTSDVADFHQINL